MNGKGIVFDGSSNYFWKVQLNEIESKIRAFNLILPEMLVYT